MVHRQNERHRRWEEGRKWENPRNESVSLTQTERDLLRTLSRFLSYSLRWWYSVDGGGGGILSMFSGSLWCGRERNLRSTDCRWQVEKFERKTTRTVQDTLPTNIYATVSSLYVCMSVVAFDAMLRDIRDSYLRCSTIQRTSSSSWLQYYGLAKEVCE